MCSEWQGSTAKDFDLSQGSIALNANGFKHDVTDTRYRFAHLSVTYHLIQTDQAGRL